MWKTQTKSCTNVAKVDGKKLIHKRTEVFSNCINCMRAFFYSAECFANIKIRLILCAVIVTAVKFCMTGA